MRFEKCRALVHGPDINSCICLPENLTPADFFYRVTLANGEVKIYRNRLNAVGQNFVTIERMTFDDYRG